MTMLRKGLSRLIITGALALSLGGCSLIYKTTGDVLQGYSASHTVPYLLETGDLEMACSMNEATKPLLMSFRRVTSEPHQLGVLMGLQTGGCLESEAREADLRGLAAFEAGNAEESQDAMIIQRRLYATVASRYHDGWKHHQAYYGDVAEGECPSFDGEYDEFIFIAGLVSGLQALNADIQSGGAAGVPKNLGSLVAESTRCVDNEKWWGVPMGLRATVWAMIPGSVPQGEDPFERLERAAELGEEARVRLTHVFQVIAAGNRNKEALVRDTIRRHVAEIEQHPSNEQWRLLDKLATHNIRAVSDRMWMKATGHRTPVGGLGSFWDDQDSDAEAMDLEGIL